MTRVTGYLGVIFATMLAANLQSAGAIKCAVSLPGGAVMATDFAAITGANRCAKYTKTCAAGSTDFYCADQTGSITVYGAASSTECTTNSWTCCTADFCNKPALWTTAAAAAFSVYMGTGPELPAQTDIPFAALEGGVSARFQVNCDTGVFGCTADEQATKVPRWMYGAMTTDDAAKVKSYVANYYESTEEIDNGRTTPVRLKCYAGASESDDVSTTGPKSYFYNACQAGENGCSFSEACRKFELKCSADYASLPTTASTTVQFCNANEIAAGVYKWVYDATTWEQCASYMNSPLEGVRNAQCCPGNLCNTVEYPQPITCWNGQEYKLFEVTTPLRDWSASAYDSCVALRFPCTADLDESLKADGCTAEQLSLGATGGQFGAMNRYQCAYLKQEFDSGNTQLTSVYSSIDCCEGDRCNGPTDYPPVMCWNGQENKIFTNEKLFDAEDAKSKCIKYQLNCDTAVTGLPGKEDCTKAGQKVWVYGSATPGTCSVISSITGVLSSSCCDGTDESSCNAPLSYDPITCYDSVTNTPKVFSNSLLNTEGERYTQCFGYKIKCSATGLDNSLKSHCTGVAGDKWVLGALQKTDQTTGTSDAATCTAKKALEGAKGVYKGTASCCTPKNATEVCNGPKDYPPLACFNGMTQVQYANTQLFAQAEAVTSCFKGRVNCDTTNMVGTTLAIAAGCKEEGTFKWYYGVSTDATGECTTYGALTADGRVFQMDAGVSTFSCCQESGCNAAEPLVCVEGFGDTKTFDTTKSVKVSQSDATKDRCYRYRIVCTFGDTRCTEAEQQKGAVKYVAGAANLSMCKMMSALQQTYHNLLCCQDNSCNSPASFKLECSEGTGETAVVSRSFGADSSNTICFSHGTDTKTYGFTSEGGCLDMITAGKSNVMCCADDCYGYGAMDSTNGQDDDDVSAGGRRRSLLADVLSWFA